MRLDFPHQGSHLTNRHREQHNIRTLHGFGSRRGDAVDDTQLECRIQIRAAPPHAYHFTHCRSLFQCQRNRTADQTGAEYGEFVNVCGHYLHCAGKHVSYGARDSQTKHRAPCAIVGAVRADYFAGWGASAAELAGRLKQPLRLWVLWPK